MRILDKYILKSFIGPFLFGVFAFTSIFVGTGTLFRIAQYITEYNASFWSVTKIFFLAIPSIIVLTFPMSSLLASLMSFGRLSGNSEIIVMRAGGQSFLRLAMPIYILAFFISIGSTLFNELVVPQANRAYQTILYDEIMKRATPKTQNNVVIKDMANGEMRALLYAAKYDADTKVLSNITVQEFDKGDVVRIENAEYATWDGSLWKMYNGNIYEVENAQGVKRVVRFDSQELPISTSPKALAQRKLSVEEMTIREIRTEIRAYRASGQNTAELQLEMYKRFTIPLASFVFAIVGACLGLQPQRSSSSMGFGISAIIIFVYYGVMMFTEALGKGNVIPPLLAASIPDLLGFIFGMYLNIRASK